MGQFYGILSCKMRVWQAGQSAKRY